MNKMHKKVRKKIQKIGKHFYIVIEKQNYW